MAVSDRYKRESKIGTTFNETTRNGFEKERFQRLIITTRLKRKYDELGMPTWQIMRGWDNAQHSWIGSLFTTHIPVENTGHSCSRQIQGTTSIITNTRNDIDQDERVRRHILQCRLS